MAKPVKMLLDPVGNTMNIWWDDPTTAATSEESDSPYRNDVIVKNAKGVPIGLEIIGVFPEELNIAHLLKTRNLPISHNSYSTPADSLGKTIPFLSCMTYG